MTTDDRARKECDRLAQEVHLAILRDTHSLLTNHWLRKAPAIAAGTVTAAAMLLVIGVAYQVLR
jgi:hypothetical protein